MLYVRRLNKMREEEVEALYRPIEAAMKESDEPKAAESHPDDSAEPEALSGQSEKSIEADRKMVEGEYASIHGRSDGCDGEELR